MSGFWVHAIGNEEYISTVKHKEERKNLIENLQSYIQKLMKLFYEENQCSPILDHNTELTFFSFGIENIFCHGLKPKIEKLKLYDISFWNFLENLPKVFPSSLRAMNELKSLKQVSTPQGRARAWIRMALNDNLLEEYCTSLVCLELTSVWYEEYAFLRSIDDSSAFLNLLAGLKGIAFSLTVDSLVLDGLTLPKENKKKKKSKVKTKTVSIMGTLGEEGSAQNEDPEKQEKERQEKESLEREKQEKEKLERERLEKEKQERERLEREKLEQQKQEKEKQEKERSEREKQEKEKLEQQKQERERQEREKLKERLAKERQEKERLEREKERQEKESLEREKQEKEKLEKERLEKEKQEKERLEREKLEQQKQERERQIEGKKSSEIEILERERMEEERLERMEKESLEKERLESLEEEKERLEKEQQNNLMDKDIKDQEKETSFQSEDTFDEDFDNETRLKQQEERKKYLELQKKLIEEQRLILEGSKPKESTNTSTSSKRDSFSSSSSNISSMDPTPSESTSFFEESSSELLANKYIRKYLSSPKLEISNKLDTFADTTPVVHYIDSSLSSSSVNSNDNTSKEEAPVNVIDHSFKRRKIFFDIPVKKTLKDQNYLCFGCGTELSRGVFSQVRYCEYTGKYFDKKCHSNQKSVVPAYILHNWDLKQYPVCNFAKELLDALFNEPAFDVSAINPQLYTKVKALKSIKILRQQLNQMRGFIMTCREKDSLIKPIASRLHLMNDVELYSLRDLLDIPQDVLIDFIREVTEKFLLHIKSCQLCQAKGSICEYCNDTQPIFPFDIANVIQCKTCNGIFHKKCSLSNISCPRCIRKKKISST